VAPSPLDPPLVASLHLDVRGGHAARRQRLQSDGSRTAKGAGQSPEIKLSIICSNMQFLT